MTTLVTVIHVVTCIVLVLVVLIQSGKGAEISASFSGSSQTIFGSSGGANFFVKFTYGTAAVFVVTSLFLTVQGSRNLKKSVFDSVAPVTNTAPAPLTPAVPIPAGQAAPGAQKQEMPGKPASAADPTTPGAPAENAAKK